MSSRNLENSEQKVSAVLTEVNICQQGMLFRVLHMLL